MKKLLSVLALYFYISIQLYSQNDTIKYEIGVMGIGSSGVSSPFWLRANSYGVVSETPFNANFQAAINKDFGASSRLFDYGFKANLLIKKDANKSELYFHELYAKARFSVFDLIVGSRKETLGNQDSTLSSGGLLFSHNAIPMPKITIGIEHYTAIPYSDGYLQVKGALVHGWFSKNAYEQGAYLHHKYAYVRIGGRLPVNIEYGLNHVGIWGGNIPGLGQQPVSLSDYKSIFFGKSGGTDAPTGEQINALGNHIISQSLKLDLKISDYKISGYWQNISEDGPIYFICNTLNIPDGLWGVSIRNSKLPFIKGFLYEYLNTTDQTGPYHDKDGIVYGGGDSYFTNYIYRSGWTYKSQIIGTAFISKATFNSDGALTSLNNRVQVHHFGIEGDVKSYQYRLLTSFSKNYSSYDGIYYHPIPPEMLRNTSIMLEVKRKFSKIQNIECGLVVSGDHGKLFGNSYGGLISIRKTGDLFKY
jgi:hypothetical protein